MNSSIEQQQIKREGLQETDGKENKENKDKKENLDNETKKAQEKKVVNVIKFKKNKKTKKQKRISNEHIEQIRALYTQKHQTKTGSIAYGGAAAANAMVASLDTGSVKSMSSYGTSSTRKSGF